MIFFEYADKTELRDAMIKKPELKTFSVSEDQHGCWQMVKAPNEAEAIVEYFKILNPNPNPDLLENFKKIVYVKFSADHSTVNAYTFEMKLEPAYYIDYYGEMP
jgi:hypothetical protein